MTDERDDLTEQLDSDPAKSAQNQAFADQLAALAAATDEDDPVTNSEADDSPAD